MDLKEKFSIAVLISGNGSNLQAIIDAIERGLPITLKAVISNQKNVYGLQRAQRAGFPAHTVTSENPQWEENIENLIEHYSPDLIVLAGFMKKLSPRFVHNYLNRIINIHPSLLPKFPGLRTHRRALAAHAKIHGASVHFVTEKLDEGPLIGQARLKISDKDTEDTLSHRVKALEHILYPQVLEWFAEGRITVKNSIVYLDGESLPKCGKLLKYRTSRSYRESVV